MFDHVTVADDVDRNTFASRNHACSYTGFGPDDDDDDDVVEYTPFASKKLVDIADRPSGSNMSNGLLFAYVYRFKLTGVSRFPWNESRDTNVAVDA